MKRIFIICLLFFSAGAFAQQHSWDGRNLKPNAKIRTLNLFVNVIYDVNPDSNVAQTDTAYWGNATMEGINTAPIPTYLTDTTFMDIEHKAQSKGTMTRLYRESSFDSLRIIGDFMVVNIKESRVLNEFPKFDRYEILHSALNYINNNGGLRTIFRHDSIADYEYRNHDTIFYIQTFFRNIKKYYGGYNNGSGSGSSGFSTPNPYEPVHPYFLTIWDSILVNNRYCKLSPKGTCQCVGGGNLAANPTGIVCHEISHSLFGGNDFHTSGGNHRATKEQMPFLTVQCGYGLMGAANSSLVGCNGYERWRMHWKHPLAPDYITARDVTNSNYTLSDISKVDGNLTFYLRDFVTYGDAVRIRLPYKDSSACSNQYIWLENHQVGYNNKLDFLQHSNTSSCRPQGAAGIYAYYQIGRDTLIGNSNTVWFRDERDNLKMIPAEGYYNYSKHELPEGESYNLHCVNWGTHNYFHQREESNPFNGYQDQEIQFHSDENENKLDTHNIYPMWRKVIGSDSIDWLPFLGDELDAFTTHVKIGMATNPSSCNAKVYYNYLMKTGENDYVSNPNKHRNVRTTYLTGLSIEMVPQANHDFLVHIRWDDYDITQQANWTGRIVLKEQAHLLRGSRITLTQNLTPEQPFRDAESGQFAPTTRMLCQNGSLLTLQGNAVMELEKKSSLLLKQECRLNLSDTASIRIGAGCRMEAAANATIRMGGQSRIFVDSGGVLLLRDSVLFSDSARIVVRPGGQLITEAALPISQDSQHFLFPPSTCLMRNEAAPAEDSVPQKKGYESFFGKNNTEWHLGYYPNNYNYICDLESVKNNFSGGLNALCKFDSNYMEINGKMYLNYFREDTTTGRLYRIISLSKENDVIEVLICDMSLNVGDTFYLPNMYDSLIIYNSIEFDEELTRYIEEGLPIVADSVFFMENKKCIRFKYISPSWYFDYLHIYFIEGVGSTYGPGFIMGYITEGLPILTCSYKDDTLVFMYNTEIGCELYFGNYPTPKFVSKTLHIYPNPAQDYLQVKNEDMADGNGEIVIVNALGMVMHRGRLVEGEARISLQGWASGIYTLLYRSQKSVQQVRFVKE